MSDDQGAYLSEAEAAKLLGISRDALRMRGARGQHPRKHDEKQRWTYLVPYGPERAAAETQQRGGQTGSFAYLYDSANKNPRYLIRNGADGAVVNQLASRVHAIAYAMGNGHGVAEHFAKRSIGATPRKEWRRSEKGRHLLHLSTRDVHVGEPGDPKQYEDEIARAVTETLEWAERAHGPIDEVLLTLGSDWLTVDNYWRQTTKGTQLQPAGDVYAVMRWAEELAIRCIDICRTKARKVVGICEQGNHDAVLGAAMARTAKAWFRACPEVEIIIPEQGGIRTYYEWGGCMFAGHHGHIKSPTQMPQIVAAERPAMWGRCSHRFILLGHRHHSQRWHLGDYAGCEIIQTRSPSRPTEYEHRMGYVDNLRTLESFVFEEGRGMVTHRRASPW
ncbi:MAG: hypothetical protein AAFO86_13435 [Pseudomonadota bacterium]